jgi:hypothetical protein
MRALWALARLDLLLWRRMPMAVASALVPPIGMAALLVVLSLAVGQQPVALVVEGRGENADRMTKIIEADDDAYALTKTDDATARRMLREQEVAAIVTIPADFESAIKEGRLATVELLLNNVDIDFADDIRRSVDRSVAHFDAPALSLEGEHGARKEGDTNPYLVDVDEHDLRGTDVGWLAYQIVPALVLLVLSVGLMGTALLCALDMERKTARYLAVTPPRSWVLVAGRLLGGFLACMIVLVPAVALCAVTGIISPPPSHWPALAAIFVATALCASGLGAILGAVLTRTRTIAMTSSVIATYLFFLGGGFTTIAFLPRWLRTASAFVPTRYSIDGMRQALFYTTLDGVPRDLLVLCLTAVVALAAGSLSVRRSWVN